MGAAGGPGSSQPPPLSAVLQQRAAGSPYTDGRQTVRAKVLTLVKSPPEFPQGLVWKGCERYRAKVKLGDIGTTALDVHPKVDAVRALNSWGWMAFPLTQAFYRSCLTAWLCRPQLMSDGVIRQWIATGIPCSTLNKQLQQARTGSPDDKQRMGTFVKAMGSRFQRMEGLFELEWPAGGAEGATVLSYRPS